VAQTDSLTRLTDKPLRSPDLTTLGYRRIVLLLVVLVILPTGLITGVGTLLMFLGEARVNLVMGILILCFTGAVVTGSVLVWVFVRREANLSKLQSDFVSKVSHELRTPLTSIRMFTETLQLRRGDSELENRCVEALGKESLRLQTLIDRLLEWGRMESGRRSFVKRETDAGKVVEAAIHAFEPVREKRDVDLEIEIPPNLPVIVADHDALVDAVVNLLSNAYKYGGEPRRIVVSASAADGRVRISVQDNGVGIAHAEHKRIFQKFYRVDDRLARQKEGSGLGLAIVEHIMRAHGGRIELDSAPGKGSTFTLILAAQHAADSGGATRAIVIGKARPES
jgi:two-component system, OmpR family, phosphate regulon sensor histidine kinase PhoR